MVSNEMGTNGYSPAEHENVSKNGIVELRMVPDVNMEVVAMQRT